MYKFELPCTISKYRAKKKIECDTAVLTKEHLEELTWMLGDHIHAKGCGGERTVTDRRITCYRITDYISVPWRHETATRVKSEDDTEEDEEAPVQKRQKTTLQSNVLTFLKKATYSELAEINCVVAGLLRTRSPSDSRSASSSDSESPN